MRTNIDIDDKLLAEAMKLTGAQDEKAGGRGSLEDSSSR